MNEIFKHYACKMDSWAQHTCLIPKVADISDGPQVHQEREKNKRLISYRFTSQFTFHSSINVDDALRKNWYIKAETYTDFHLKEKFHARVNFAN